MKLFILLLLPQIVFANIFEAKNTEVIEIKKTKVSVLEILKDYAKFKKYNLLVDEKIQGELSLFGKNEIDKKEFDLYVSSIAEMNGYTLLINDDTQQIEIINARDIRYRGGLVYQEIDNVPDTYNHAQFAIKLKFAPASEISRNLRPFMSRYGRVIDEKNSNTLILSDTGRNIHRLHQLITRLDTENFNKRRELVHSINEKAVTETTNETSLKDFIHDQFILFLISFSLLGSIIGFGIRGYMMKKIEGGW